MLSYQAKYTRPVAVALFTALLVLWQGDLPAARAGEVQVVPEKVVLENFPVYAQWHNLSCEYSSTRMMTAFWGREIAEAEFINNIPFHSNPHIGFRGNIDGPFGGTWDYGIYAEPIARYLNTRGFKTKLLAGGSETLKQELALGRPVQVWVIAGMGWGSPFTISHEGAEFRLAGGEHSIVIYGYDQRGVYVADPAYGGRAYYGWETFMRSWSYFDFMAMSFWPADKPTGPEPGPGIYTEFYRHWLNAGDIPVLGKPLSEVTFVGVTAVQYFERARLELDTSKPYNPEVRHGLLGSELTEARRQESPFLPVGPSSDPDSRYFEATGHTLSNGFKEFWERNGSLANFGFPLSQEFTEDGKTVQYFERARLEYYPANPDPYKILLGRLGAERQAR